MKWRVLFFYVMILLAACQDGVVSAPETEMPIKLNEYSALDKVEQSDSKVKVVVNEGVNNEYEQLINNVSCEPKCHLGLVPV